MKATKLLLVIVFTLFLISVTGRSHALRNMQEVQPANATHPAGGKKKPEGHRKPGFHTDTDGTDNDMDQSDIDERNTAAAAANKTNATNATNVTNVTNVTEPAKEPETNASNVTIANTTIINSTETGK